VKIERTMVISRPARDLYAFWIDLERLPHVLNHLKRVDANGEQSHWVARGPFEMDIEWDAEVLSDRENELIAWRSLPGGDIETAGSVHFRPLAQNRGTEVSVSLKYNPPGGKLGALVASWLGADLEEMVAEDLQRFKQLMESGTTTTTGQPIVAVFPPT
jgi:uncharacterized membrane protein